MNAQVTMNISLAVSNLLTFLGGALIVWLLWQRDHRRRTKAVNHLRSAIHTLVCDGRKNSLIENIISGIERGKLPAQRDFEILDRVVRAAFVVFGTSGLWKVWQKYRERAFAAWRDKEAEGPVGEEAVVSFCGRCDLVGPDHLCRHSFAQQTQVSCVRKSKCVWARVGGQGGIMTTEGFEPEERKKVE